MVETAHKQLKVDKIVV